MVSCRQAGLYIQGEKSHPVVLHNVFMVCKCSSIIVNTNVDAFIGMNEMQINDCAIEIINNDSIIFENTVQKSTDNGILILCDNPNTPCQPTIQKNYIEASTHNGIVCQGIKCWP